MTYLQLAEKHDIFPNFWCSEEYWEKAGWKEFILNDGTHVICDDKGKYMLPSLHEDLFPKCKSKIKYWAGFSSQEDSNNPNKFIDYEFIYDPNNFEDLSGSKWAMTRKNLKWAKKDTGEENFHYFDINNIPNKERLNALITYFVKENIDEQKIYYDNEVMIKYLLFGQYRLIISDWATDKIYGICCWDMNYRFVNFRYCLVKKGIRGLSDTCRLIFYKTISGLGLLVNDGGSLGSNSLYQYKKRLNPMMINKIMGFEI